MAPSIQAATSVGRPLVTSRPKPGGTSIDSAIRPLFKARSSAA